MIKGEDMEYDDSFEREWFKWEKNWFQIIGIELF
jgi:hypothetical protein